MVSGQHVSIDWRTQQLRKESCLHSEMKRQLSTLFLVNWLDQSLIFRTNNNKNREHLVGPVKKMSLSLPNKLKRKKWIASLPHPSRRKAIWCENVFSSETECAVMHQQPGAGYQLACSGSNGSGIGGSTLLEREALPYVSGGCALYFRRWGFIFQCRALMLFIC